MKHIISQSIVEAGLSRIVNIAIVESRNSTCDRLSVGAIIFDPISHYIISTGFNTSPLGMGTCKEKGHLLKDNHCIRTIHAEQVAIAYAVLHSRIYDNDAILITHSPCIHCIKLIIQCKFKWVYFLEEYKNMEDLDLLLKAGIVVTKLYYVSNI